MTSQPNSGPETLELIQVFRGLAATLVVLHHVSTSNGLYFPFLGGLVLFGHCGVDFFFILSGFIILYVHWDKAGAADEVGRFLALRATRIFPLYWCVLAVTVVCFWWFGEPPGGGWVPKSTLTADTLARAVVLYRQDFEAIVRVAWTLSYELVFYAFFAAYFLVGARPFVVLMLVWSALILLRWNGVVNLGFHPILLRPLVAEFFLGCLAAFLVRRVPLRVAAGWLLLPVGLLAGLALAEWQMLIDGYAWWWAPPFFLLVLLGAAYDRATRRRYPRWLVLLGAASYAIYLVHLNVIALFAATLYLWRPTAYLVPNLVLCLLTLAVLGVGTAVHLIVERPLLAGARRWLGASRRAPTFALGAGAKPFRGGEPPG